MTTEYFEIIAGFFLIAIICIMIALGILVNIFIVTTNLNCWKKSQPLKAIDMIITSLAMARIILLSSYVLFIIDNLHYQSVTTMTAFPEYTITFTLSVEFCSLWWGSMLCVFYCVKITNDNNRFFIRVKVNISKMVPWMLLLSVVPSLLSSLPFKWFVFSFQSYNGTDGLIGVIKENWLNYFMICFAGSFMPFLIFCFFIGLLIVSLLRHSRIMSSRSSGFTDAQPIKDLHLLSRKLAFMKNLDTMDELYDLVDIAYQDGIISKHTKDGLLPVAPKLALSLSTT
ncbi:taste receptor type 2 member 40-like [Phyllobates terribilis]|uniref:taste receptor type 2 member 40-like n=1 Tax=Phyllobates terribilis TaxID=111132 RepID=UPI003CCACADA